MTKLPYKLAVLLNRVQDHGLGPVRPAGDEYRCRCPAHEDSTPSLYVRLAENRILVRCSAGCTAEAVVHKLNLDMADLFLGDDDPVVGWGGPALTAVSRGADTPPPACAAGLVSLVYTAVLGALDLSTAHRDALLARGLDANAVDRNQYRTTDPAKATNAAEQLLGTHTQAELLSVPGFEIRGGRLTLTVPAGLVVPVRAVGGAVVALKVRMDEAGGPKYLVVSSTTSKASAACHVPLGVTSPAEAVRVTEGELKADVAYARSGLPTVGVPGVNQWPLAIPVLKAMCATRVLLAMDRDRKAGTLAATIGALEGLAAAGFDVDYETWDAAAGKGVDDLLAGGGTPEVLDGLAGLVRLRRELAQPEAVETLTPAAAPFPADVFPPPLADFLRQAAAATTTPPDFGGTAMLAVAGAAIGNSTEIELKSGAWYEGANLTAGLVGEPSAGKTPALNLALAPLRARERHELAEYTSAVARHQAGDTGDDAAAPPPPKRCLVVDATAEASAQLIAANPRGVLKHVEEGSGIKAEHGQYKGGRGTDRQFYMACWSRTRATVDRVSRAGVPLAIELPFLAMLFGIQPDMLSELGDHKGRSDGDLDRKLWAYPDRLPAANWSDDGVSAEAAAAWAAAVERMFAIPMPTDADGCPAPTRVRFTPAGKAAWETWFNDHAAELRDPALSPALLGPWAKFRSYAARLTLILHTMWVDGEPGDVGPESVERAARLVTYFKEHARRVYARLRQAPEDGRLHAALDWVRLKRGGRCTARDLLQNRFVADSEAARKLVKELVERGHGRVEPMTATNGRKVDWFVIDPT